MPEELKILIIFIIWLFSAYFGSFSSWGVSVLSVGLLTILGLSPQLASITFKLGKIGDILGGLYLFYKNGHIPKKFVIWGSIVSVGGSFLGSYLIFSIPDYIIYSVSAITMITLAVVSYYKKAWGKNMVHISQKREYMYYVWLFFLTMIGNLFIAGSGVWYYFINTFVIRLTSLEAKGMAAVLSVFWFIGTFAGIMATGQYVISWGIALALGMFIGGYFGTKHIIKLGNDIFRNILLFSIILFAVYFLYKAFISF